MQKLTKKPGEITVYDAHDTTAWIDAAQPKSLQDLNIQLPDTPPTEVVSLRLPTRLLKSLRAWASNQDIPYQALIKLFITQGMRRATR